MSFPSIPSRPFRRAWLLLALLTPVAAWAEPKIEIPRHKACNLFDQAAPVSLSATLRGFPAGAGDATVQLTNFFGEKKTTVLPVQITAGKATSVPLDLGILEPGYYDLNLTVKLKPAAGPDVSIQSPPASFGVVRPIHRTSKEARDAGSRFGLKMFQIGAEGIWWNRTLTWDIAEVVDACTQLGLQWTRHQFNEAPQTIPGAIGVTDLITKHAMNTVLKIEGFPESCYDTARYGPLEEWKANHKGKQWNRYTVPQRAPYQAWLKTQLANIPADQNIFELGNEVWSNLTPEEFAEWCKMTVPIVREVRPKARIGADPGNGEYARKFLAAGGMEGLEIWYNHPYSFTPLPEHRTRAAIRNMRDLMRTRTGKDYDLYITEYGWPTAPQDRRGNSVSERVQAQRTVRQSLMLYAEDAKVLIPHWMGDREQDPTEREHFFGFFHLNQHPKPVVIAHAVCARMVDGSLFVGDLWLGPGVGAMLFERGGQFTLALWTAEEDKKVEVNVGVPEVTVVDLMGREKKVRTTNGKLPLALDGSATYLQGVSPFLATTTTPPTADLNPDVWSTREGSFTIKRLAARPGIDGMLVDWAGATKVELKNPKVAPADATATVMLAYDDARLYLALQITDDAVTAGDRFEFMVGKRPSRQPDLNGLRNFDYVYTFIPPVGGAKPAMQIRGDVNNNQPVDIPQPDIAGGIKWAIKAVPGGWTAEVAIPHDRRHFGPRLAARFLFTDVDSDKDKAALSYGDERPRLWPYLILGE